MLHNLEHHNTLRLSNSVRGGIKLHYNSCKGMEMLCEYVLVLADMNTNATMLVTFTSSIYDADRGCVISEAHAFSGVG